VDERGGFGHLPDNGDGLETSIGPHFNVEYQKWYETRGYIRDRAENEYHWEIEDNGSAITVTINGTQH
jgi:hypothetical protein